MTEPVFDDRRSRMSMLTQLARGGPRGLSRILVATDGTPGAAGAVRLAQLLADRHDSTVDVITVLQPLLSTSNFTAALAASPLRVEKATARIRQHLTAVLGEAPRWPITVTVEPVAAGISGAAAQMRSDLVIMGLGRRDENHRLESQTAVQVASISPVPLLAVPEHARDLPARAVVGTDFGSSSVAAARLALDVASRGAFLHVAHARRAGEALPAQGESDRLPGETTDRLFGALEEPTGDIATRWALLDGDSATALARYATANWIELIAIGSRGRRTPDGDVCGPDARRVMLSASCCVLLSGTEAARRI